MFARIDGSTVSEVWDIDELPPLHPTIAAMYVECDETVKIGMLYDGSHFSVPLGHSEFPQMITKLQLKHQLEEMGLWESVWIAIQSDPDTYVEFLLASCVDATNPSVVALAEAFGITNGSYEQMFRDAAAL